MKHLFGGNAQALCAPRETKALSVRKNSALMHKATLRTFISIFMLLSLSLCGCAQQSMAEQESEEDYTLPDVRLTVFNEEEAVSERNVFIDVSSANAGYVMTRAISSSALKFQMLCNDGSYNYDMPSDGTAVAFPVNMGDGLYTLRVMEQVEGSTYIELFSTQVDVVLDSEFEPFLSPSVYCDFSEDSACVTLARDLAKDAKSQAAAAEAIYSWITSNIDYDSNKASAMQNATGYTPHPDDTLSSQTGICFDYASLAAAMLRSVGIPTKIVTGYVANGSIYHAWNMVYLQGKWVNVGFTVPPREWSRIDATFASSGPSVVGGKKDYVDRFTY